MNIYTYIYIKQTVNAVISTLLEGNKRNPVTLHAVSIYASVTLDRDIYIYINSIASYQILFCILMV